VQVATTAAVSQPSGLTGTDALIEVEGVGKAVGSVQALVDVSLHAQAGLVVGLLGLNGAGKTMLVRILTTLLRPDSGHPRVAGLDIVRDAVALRSAIGLAGQHAAVDEMLTGRENIELVGQLYHLGQAERPQRAERVLVQFQLAGAADRPVRTYSGGMRRRLDLAASLVGQPPVLILDDPPTGRHSSRCARATTWAPSGCSRSARPAAKQSCWACTGPTSPGSAAPTRSKSRRRLGRHRSWVRHCGCPNSTMERRACP